MISLAEVKPRLKPHYRLIRSVAEKKSTDRAWIIALVAIAIFLHRGYLSSGVLVGGDSVWLSPQTMAGYLQIPQAWDPTAGTPSQGLGFANYDLNVAPLNFAFGILSAIGFSFAFAQRILIFFPAAVLPFLSMYWFAGSFTKRPAARAAAALLYGANTYPTTIGVQHLYLVLTYGLAPIIWQTFLNSARMVSLNGLRNWLSVRSVLAFALSIAITLAIDARMAALAYVVMIAIGAGLVLGKSNTAGAIKTFVTGSVALFAFELYWILPATIGGNGGSYGAIVPDTPVGSSTTFLHSLVLNHAYATGGEPIWFLQQPVMKPLLVLPLLAALGYYVSKRSQRPLVTPMLLVAAVGVFLAKGNSAPFGSAYDFIYGHVPGMSLFRDSTKFMMCIAAGYSVGIALFVDFALFKWSKRNDANGVRFDIVRNGVVQQSIQVAKVVTACLLVLFTIAVFWGDRAQVKGHMGWATTSVKVPPAEGTFAQFLDNDKTFGRVLWLPLASRFYAPSATHPIVVPSSLSSVTTGALATPSSPGQIMQQNPALLDSNTLRLAGIHYVAVFSDINSEYWTELYPSESVRRTQLAQYSTRLSSYGYRAIHFAPDLDVYIVPNTNSLFTQQADASSNATVNGKNLEWQDESQSTFKTTGELGGRYLRYNASYSPGWVATFKSGNKTIKSVHAESQDGTNLWKVSEASGPVTATISYKPQRVTNFGAALSLIFVVIALAILLWPLSEQKKQQIKQQTQSMEA